MLVAGAIVPCLFVIIHAAYVELKLSLEELATHDVRVIKTQCVLLHLLLMVYVYMCMWLVIRTTRV